MKTCLTLLLGLALSISSVLAGHGDTHMFKVKIANVSQGEILKLSSGGTAPAPFSPGLWAVHTGSNPMFMSGKKASAGLEVQAEDGNPDMLLKELKGSQIVTSSGVFKMSVETYQEGPILPGQSVEFRLSAMPGELLSLVTMFGQSNDLFYGTNGNGIALFDDKGMPMSGDFTTMLSLWNAGTELNEEPGIGLNQAPRQKAMNTGMSENGTVGMVKDSFTYPTVAEVIKVTITSLDDEQSKR